MLPRNALFCMSMADFTPCKMRPSRNARALLSFFGEPHRGQLWIVFRHANQMHQLSLVQRGNQRDAALS